MEDILGWGILPVFFYWVFLMLVDKDPWSGLTAIFLAPYFSILPTLYLVFFGKSSKNSILKKLVIFILLSFFASTISLFFERALGAFFFLEVLIPGYIICFIIFFRFREKKVTGEVSSR